ncbi:uncharacterized protein SPPG_03265 [Spizellomyces punctatus DAOM BR117]|uniref:Uncharacterized protein n=1 Tax=Spizellomyces punctatus (strain DAOM BR117) TaxID=645134 RepID=A0A0L0HKA4_SPIPD|nr:uncharacterized protein SPPG_03265 [Spizellomyces punctatus DAOM BR117]KND01463.1 hypothetical protein SPPG_03265 [Spizellomyces punctatus DAOM BR117]|eukprot:XP_016609502.1 hypothetical protein SPPG_03265 [Spizellomyces punctatus DAOM BR117]
MVGSRQNLAGPATTLSGPPHFPIDTLERSLKNATELLYRARAHQRETVSATTGPSSFPIQDEIGLYVRHEKQASARNVNEVDARRMQTHTNSPSVRVVTELIGQTPQASKISNKEVGASSLLQASIEQFRKHLSEQVVLTDDTIRSDKESVQEHDTSQSADPDTIPQSAPTDDIIRSEKERVQEHDTSQSAHPDTIPQSADVLISTIPSFNWKDALVLMNELKVQLGALNHDFREFLNGIRMSDHNLDPPPEMGTGAKREKQSTVVSAAESRKMHLLERIEDALHDFAQMKTRMGWSQLDDVAATRASGQESVQEPDTSHSAHPDTIPQSADVPVSTIPSSNWKDALVLMNELKMQLGALHRDFREFLNGTHISDHNLDPPPEMGTGAKQNTVTSQPGVAASHKTQFLERIEDALYDFAQMKRRMGWSPLDDVAATRASGKQVVRPSSDSSPTSDLLADQQDLEANGKSKRMHTSVAFGENSSSKRLRASPTQTFSYSGVTKALREIREKTSLVMGNMVESEVSSTSLRPTYFNFSDLLDEDSFSDVFNHDRIKAVVTRKIEELAIPELSGAGRSRQILSETYPRPMVNVPILQPKHRQPTNVKIFDKTANRKTSAPVKRPLYEPTKPRTKTQENVVLRARKNEGKLRPAQENLPPKRSLVSFPPSQREMASTSDPAFSGNKRVVTPQDITTGREILARHGSAQRPLNLLNVRVPNSPVFLRPTSIRPPNAAFTAKSREMTPPRPSQPTVLKQSAPQITPINFPSISEINGMSNFCSISHPPPTNHCDLTVDDDLAGRSPSGVELSHSRSPSIVSPKKTIGVQYVTPPKDVSIQYQTPEGTSPSSSLMNVRMPTVAETRRAMRKIVKEELTHRKEEALRGYRSAATSPPPSGRLGTFEQKLAEWVQAEVLTLAAKPIPARPLPSRQDAQTMAELQQPASLPNTLYAAEKIADKILQEVISAEGRNVAFQTVIDVMESRVTAATQQQLKQQQQQQQDSKAEGNRDSLTPRNTESSESLAVLNELKLLRKAAEEDKRNSINEDEQWRRQQEERLRAMEQQINKVQASPIRRRDRVESAPLLLPSVPKVQVHVPAAHEVRKMDEAYSRAKLEAEEERRKRRMETEEHRRRRRLEEEEERIKLEQLRQERRADEARKELDRRKRQLEEEERLHEEKLLEIDRLHREKLQEMERIAEAERKKREQDLEDRLHREKLDAIERSAEENRKKLERVLEEKLSQERKEQEEKRAAEEEERRRGVQFDELRLKAFLDNEEQKRNWPEGEIVQRVNLAAEEALRKIKLEKEDFQRRQKLAIEETERKRKLEEEEEFQRRQQFAREEAERKQKLEEEQQPLNEERKLLQQALHESANNMQRGEEKVGQNTEPAGSGVERQEITKAEQSTKAVQTFGFQEDIATSKRPTQRQQLHPVESSRKEIAVVASSDTSSVGLTTLSLMLSEGEVRTQLFSEGEVAHPISQRFFRTARALSGDEESEGSSTSRDALSFVSLPGQIPPIPISMRSTRIQEGHNMEPRRLPNQRFNRDGDISSGELTQSLQSDLVPNPAAIEVLSYPRTLPQGREKSIQVSDGELSASEGELQSQTDRWEPRSVMSKGEIGATDAVETLHTSFGENLPSRKSVSLIRDVPSGGDQSTSDVDYGSPAVSHTDIQGYRRSKLPVPATSPATKLRK